MITGDDYRISTYVDAGTNILIERDDTWIRRRACEKDIAKLSAEGRACWGAVVAFRRDDAAWEAGRSAARRANHKHLAYERLSFFSGRIVSETIISFKKKWRASIQL